MGNRKYIHSEYKISDFDQANDSCKLSYKSGVLGEEGAVIIVSKEVFEYANEHSPSLRELMKLFNLQNNRVLYTTRKPRKYKEPEPAKGVLEQHVINGYILTKEEDGYYINYQMSANGGPRGRFQIEKHVFDHATKEKLTLKEIFKKYDFSRTQQY